MERASGPVAAAIRASATLDAPAASPAAFLGLESVPARIGRLSSGMLYSLACDQQAVRLPLAACALGASLRTGKKCVLVTAADPAMFVRKARLAGVELAESVGSADLTIFQLAAEADKHMFRIGPQGLLRELELNVSGRGAFLVLDQADALFMLSDARASAEAAQTYQQWVADHEHTMLALFAPSAMAPREYLALRRAAENFGGFAVARSSFAGGTLEVRHWFALEGASPRESFALRLHGAGTISMAYAASQDELPPVDTVVYARGAMPATACGVANWQEAPSHAEVLQAARRSESAILLLAFRDSADFPALCATVAAIREMARPELRVAVRECARRLRAAQALALMRLGVSSVIPIDVPDVGAKRIVDLLQNTRYTRPCESDFEQVMDEALQFLHGTVSSATFFCETIEAWLAAADGFDFECCLVRTPLQGDPATAVSRIRKLGRDLLCIEKNGELWLFLFGCPQAASRRVLQRLLPAAAERSWSLHFKPEEIAGALENLRSG